MYVNKILTFFLMVFGIAFISSTLPDQEIKESIARGKEVYAVYCMTCHMENGEGLPGVNPPLAKADYLKKPSKTLIDVLLKGQTGEVVVNGVTYNIPMPSQEYLTDIQIADVLNFVKNSWGNKIPGPISPAMVASLRKK